MENIYRDNSNPSNVFENGASSPQRQISFNSLSNQKLRTFKFNDEDKARVHIYLKKLVK